MLHFFSESNGAHSLALFQSNHEEIQLLFEQYKKAESIPARKQIIEKLLAIELDNMEETGLSI